MPVFKVWTEDRQTRKTVIANSLEELKTKGCEKLGIPVSGCKITTRDGSEVDDDDVLIEMRKNEDVFIFITESEPQCESAVGASPSKKHQWGLSTVDSKSTGNQVRPSTVSLKSSEYDANSTGCQKLCVTETNCQVGDEVDGLEINSENVLMEMGRDTFVILQSSEEWTAKEVVENSSTTGIATGAIGATTVSTKCNIEIPTHISSNNTSCIVNYLNCEGSSQNLTAPEISKRELSGVDSEEIEVSDVTGRPNSGSRNKVNNCCNSNEDSPDLSTLHSQPSSDGDVNSTPCNTKQKHAVTTNLESNSVQSVPLGMSTLKYLVGDVKIITQHEYNTISKIILAPEFKETVPSKEYFRIILPYIRQRVKMRGCHVLQPSRITALLGVGTEPEFISSSNPFEQSSTMQHVKKDVSYPICRLDLITCLLNSADDIVKLDLLSSMAQFSMALPLVMRKYDDGTYLIMSPHLCGLKVKWEAGSGDSHRIVEHSLFRDKFRLIVAVRLGNNHTGKSTILNQLFAMEHIFSSIKEPGLQHGKPFSLDGSVEMVWLTKGTCKENFWNTISNFYSDGNDACICLLANLHGDATGFPETVELLNEISHHACRYLVFICNDCTPDKWTNFQQCAGKERIAFTIRVDPVDYKPYSLNDIETSNLLGYETHRKIHQIIKKVLETSVPSMHRDRSARAETGNASLTVDLGTTESQVLTNFIEAKSCKSVKKIMELQRNGYSTDSEAKKRSILNSNAELKQIITLISNVLNLPHLKLQLAVVHIERELARLSDCASQKAYDVSSEKINKLELAKNNNDTLTISIVRGELQSALKEIGECYLSVEHLLREISCVHEVLQSDPTISSIHRNVADLFIDGQAIELVDGDVGGIPECWLKSIFSVVEHKFPSLRVFVVSIIGLQSSGKSTLLNTLFACRFPVSVGRCTRGLFMRLLFLEKELVETHNFDAIMLIDTEGLGSPEKMNDPETAKKDRQMATFAMSISNLTLINVLGENIVEMTSILQIAIVALTRLQNTKISPDIIMTQCLTGENNQQRAAPGQHSFTDAIGQALKFVGERGTKFGAGSECLNTLKKRVEDGSIVVRLGIYREGSTVSAPPSEVYHEDAVALYRTILDCGDKSKKSIFMFNTWHRLVIDSWKAVGRENFASHFQTMKALIEHVDREEGISQCKRSIDEAFNEHSKILKESIESEVNVVTIDALREKKREMILKSIEEKLKVIPTGCQKTDTCSESRHVAQKLYESIDDQRVRAETVTLINDHVTRRRESSMDMLRKTFDAELIRRGCSVEFDSRISERTHQYLAMHGNETLSEAESTTIAIRIFEEVQAIAATMERPTPITKNFADDLIKVYMSYPEIGHAFRSATMKFEDTFIVTGSPENSKYRGFPIFLRKRMSHKEFDNPLSREMQDLKKGLGAIPQQIIIRSRADSYDYSMIEELKIEVDENLKQFQKSNRELYKNINVMRLHIWVQQLLLELVKTRHTIWDEKTNPVMVLEANRGKYIQMIKTRLVHGFGYKSEGNVMAEHIANAIQSRATEEVADEIVDSIKRQPWTKSSVLVRIRYFAELAIEVKNGRKDRVLRHFLKPQKSIQKWFDAKVDAIAENATKLFKRKFTYLFDRGIEDLCAVSKMEEISTIVKSYYGSYSPAKQVDLSKYTADNLTMLKTALLEALDRSLPQIVETYSLKDKPSKNDDIMRRIGCTQECYWCNAFCWFDVNHGLPHSTSHQPRGLRRTHYTDSKRLVVQPCHETSDDTTVYWENCEKGMPWRQAKAEHFHSWAFQLFKDKTFDNLMRWFFQELHVDIAKQRSTAENPIEPASDGDLEKFGCKGLYFSTIMSALLNYYVMSFKEEDFVEDEPFITDLKAEIKKEQMQLVRLA